MSDTPNVFLPCFAEALTKRELFAAMALSGWLASFPADAPPPKKEKLGMHAELAVNAADALRAALRSK